MLTFDWLSPDISKAIYPPKPNTPLHRSAVNLRACIDQFDVEHAERYRVRDVDGDGIKETFCNIFVSDVTRAMWADIPHRINGKWQLVHDNASWLKAGTDGWHHCSGEEAQAVADLGRPAVAVYDPADIKHGHIAMIVPSEGAHGIWIAQAGARNYRRAPIAMGFGAFAPECFFFHHA